MTRLVDPIHFFNSFGQSVVNEAHLHQRIAELNAENQALRERVTRLQARIAERQSLSD